MLDGYGRQYFGTVRVAYISDFYSACDGSCVVLCMSHTCECDMLDA